MTKQHSNLALGIAATIAAAAVEACSGNSSDSSASATSAPGTDLLAKVKQRGTIIVATDTNYKPQSYRNNDGTWVGFDVDVAREIARRLGVKVQFDGSNFDTITAGSWSGRWDINVDSMAITAPRTKALYFTAPYSFIDASFAVRADSPVRSIVDLAHKKVGVGIATTDWAYLLHKLKTSRVPAPAGVSIVVYQDDQLALNDLGGANREKLDAVVTALPTIRAAIAAGMPLRVIEPPPFSDAAAIALDRNSPANPQTLLWAIDAIIDQMHRDGTLSRLSMKYYGIDLTVRAKR
jgi:polar amino acid transport system substrate-binding protein